MRNIFMILFLFPSLQDMSNVDTIADIGSGAGFPSIPLKICFPSSSSNDCDSLNKRIRFLQHLVSQLGLEHVTCVHGQSRGYCELPEHRDRYDLVTASAVARLASLNEFCLPFVRTAVCSLAMKGADPEDELKDRRRSMTELKSEEVIITPSEVTIRTIRSTFDRY